MKAGNRKHCMQLGRRDTAHSHKVINAITLSDNEEDLRSATNKIAKETQFDKFFAYGYGTHHFWLTHRRLSNGEPKEHRLLIAEF